MSTSTNTAPSFTGKPASSYLPAGMHTVTPHLICAGAASAIEFYKKAFNATERGRLAGPDGLLMHGEITIEGSVVMLFDEMPQWGAFGPKSLKGTPVSLHIYVKDVDAAMAQAEKAGAKVIMPVSDTFWGDRYGQVEDPFGHRWSLATHKYDLTSQEIEENFKQVCASGEGCASNNNSAS